MEAASFLHAHGLDVEVDELNSALKAAIDAILESCYAAPGQEGLTEAELVVARAGGLDPSPQYNGSQDPLVLGVATYAALLETGLTTRSAAELLGVTEARIRQRIGESSLLGIKHGRTWKLPIMQFGTGGELPGWATVCRSLPRDASPVMVARWLDLPHPDLAIGGDEDPTSPRRWLLEGRPSGRVAELAVELE